MENENWKLVERIPGGHKVFAKKSNPMELAIADESGDFPDETDDGTLWLDMRRPVVVSEGPTRDYTTRPRVQVPLYDGKEKFNTFSNVSAVPLWNLLGYRVIFETIVGKKTRRFEIFARPVE